MENTNQSTEYFNTGSESSNVVDNTSTTDNVAEQDMAVKKVAPEKLTIAKLKSVLTAAEVTLPPTQQKKQFYVDLFREKIGEFYEEEEGDRKEKRERESEEIENNRSHKRRRITEGEESVEEGEAEEEARERTTSDEGVVGTDENTDKLIHRRSSIHVLPKNTFVPSRRGTLTGSTTRDLWNGRADLTADNRRYSSTYVRNSLFEQTNGERKSVTSEQNQISTPATLRSNASTPTDSDFVKQFIKSPGNEFLIARDLNERAPIPDLSPSRARDQEKSKILNFFSYLAKLLLWILVFFLVFAFVSYRRIPRDSGYPWNGPGYCDSEKNCGTTPIINYIAEHCQPCPIQGYCCGGRLISCQDPLVRFGAQCIDPSDTPNPALHLATYIQNVLSTHAGKYDCKEENTRGIPTSTVRQLLKDQYSIYFADVRGNATDADEKQFELTYSKLLTLIRDPVNGITINDDYMESNIGVKPLMCVISSWAMKYRVVICGLVFMAILVIAIQNAYSQIQQRKYLLEDKVIIALTRLRDVVRCDVNELKDALIADYGESQIADDWDEICKLIDEDERVQAMVDDEGRNLWEWIGERTSFEGRDLLEDFAEDVAAQE